MIRRLVLIGIAFFTGEDRKLWRSKLVHKTQLAEQFEQFEQFRARWDCFVTNRLPEVPPHAKPS